MYTLTHTLLIIFFRTLFIVCINFIVLFCLTLILIYLTPIGGHHESGICIP